MRKVYLAVLFALTVLLVPLLTLAAGPPTEPPGNGDTAIVHLGKAKDKNGAEVEGIKIIHYKKGFAKGGGGSKGGGTTCYAFLASGARWKVTEPYLVSGVNLAGLDPTALSTAIATSAATWEAQVSFDIFGPETAGVIDGADEVAPDGKNEVLFGAISEAGAIAVTTVWGVFSGPPRSRYLVEWDMVFDDVDFPWSTTGEAGKMDLLNIAVHEVGHAAGMGHPSDTCTEETMYRYADYGETKKRDLNTGDIAGVKALYK
jgi:hypothetical protein